MPLTLSSKTDQLTQNIEFSPQMMCSQKVSPSPIFDSDWKMDAQSDEIEFLIDATSLLHCPLRDNMDIYNHLGSTVSKLTVIDVSEEDIGLIFSTFKCIRHLTLQSLTLLHDDPTEYPADLLSLSITDCKINQDLVCLWFSEKLAATLTSIEISRSHYKLSLDQEGSLSEPHFLMLLPNVRHLSLRESGVLKFACSPNGSGLSRLVLVARKCILSSKLLFLKYLSFDVFDRVDEMLLQLDCKETLNTLILRNCPKNIDILRQLQNLEHLRILNGVDSDVMATLKAMSNLKTLDVHCAESLEENQLLTLDDDSMIHILSYLYLDDWLSVMQTDARLNRIVRRNMFPSAQVKIDDRFMAKYPLKERRDIYTSLGQNVRSLLLSCDQIDLVLPHFVKLRKLYIPHRGEDPAALDVIPNGLQKLDLFIHHENQSLSRLFQRLNRTLTSLEICGPFDSNDLLELCNIRELKLGGFTSSAISVLAFLRQNQDSIERFEIKFYDTDAYDEEDYEQQVENQPAVDFELCPLKKLKVLRLDSLSKPLSLRPADFPCLEELRISFDNYTNPAVVVALIENVIEFTSLKGLQINGLEHFEKLYRLKNLRCLELYEQFLPEDIVLDLIRNLPRLKRLGTENDTFSLQFEVALQKMMVECGREVTLYHCVWPETKVRFGAMGCGKGQII